MKKPMVAKAAMIGCCASMIGLASLAYADATSKFNPFVINDFNTATTSPNLHEITYHPAASYLWGESQRLNYGVELGYSGKPKTLRQYSQSFEDIAGKYTNSYVDLLGVSKYSLSESSSDGFYLIGKAGVAHVSQQINEDIDSNDFSSLNKTINQLRPEVAFGTGYSFSKRVGLDITYQHVFPGQNEENIASQDSLLRGSSINTLQAGFTYRFP